MSLKLRNTLLLGRDQLQFGVPDQQIEDHFWSGQSAADLVVRITSALFTLSPAALGSKALANQLQF